MMSRQEMENLILMKLLKLRSAEGLLRSRFATLNGNSEARAEFLSSLANLRVQVEQLDKLLTAHARGGQRASSTAA